MAADNSEELKKCAKLLDKLITDPLLEAFYYPVDWEGLNLLDYPKVVKNPMDLTTISNKLKAGRYQNARDFARDVKLVWTNCMLYNQDESDLHILAKRTDKAFERAMKQVISGPSTGTSGPGASVSNNKPNQSNISDTPKPKPKKRKSNAVGENAPSTAKSAYTPAAAQVAKGNTGSGGAVSTGRKAKTLTDDEREQRREFVRVLYRLSEDQVGHIVQLLDQICPRCLSKKFHNVQEENSEEEVSINLDALDQNNFDLLLNRVHSLDAANAAMSGNPSLNVNTNINPGNDHQNLYAGPGTHNQVHAQQMQHPVNTGY